MFASVREILREDQVDALTRRELNDRFAEIRRLKGAVAAYEARLVRAVDGLGDRGLDGRGMLRAQGKTSDQAAARAAETAKMLTQLPKVEAALEEGRITAEHADAMADAADKIAGKATPAEAEAALLGDAEIAPADVFAKRSREWAAKKARDDGAADLAQQRRNRSGRCSVDKVTGLHRFFLELDREQGAAAKNALEERERLLWRDDGGREGSPADMRTHEQRMADAFVELLTGAGAATPTHPRNQVTVVFDLHSLTDDHGTPLASMVTDGLPLPAAVLERISCTAGITPMLFDGPGRPIWVGRDHRTATIAQWRALIARDRGCVGCGAGPDRCEAHHILPWELWGNTDIENLVLVCSRCHHDLHHRGMVLRRSEGRWQIVSRGGPAPLPYRLPLTA